MLTEIYQEVDLVKELCIAHFYRHVNPTTKLYTWHNIWGFARLDRIYVSTFLKSHIQCITNTPCPDLDHDSVNTVFCLPSANRKKNYWKLNVSILEDVEYIHLVHQFWAFLSEKTGFPDLLIWWDIRKCKVKQITQEYCITRQKNIIHLCESLRKDIDALSQKVIVNPEMAVLYDEKCKQQKGIIGDKLRGSCIRTQFHYVNEMDTSLT